MIHLAEGGGINNHVSKIGFSVREGSYGGKIGIMCLLIVLFKAHYLKNQDYYFDYLKNDCLCKFTKYFFSSLLHVNLKKYNFQAYFDPVLIIYF